MIERESDWLMNIHFLIKERTKRFYNIIIALLMIGTASRISYQYAPHPPSPPQKLKIVKTKKEKKKNLSFKFVFCFVFSCFFF
jgi:hypothetical protein